MNQNKIKIIAVLLLLCISAAWLERYEIQESGQNLSGQMADKMKQNTDEPQNLYAQSAVLMDADSGRVLFGKEEEAIRPMASTTKIMTCIIALEHMTDNEIVTASAYAASQPKVHLGVREGQQFYLRDILFSLMLESHNDSAVMVAEEIAGSVEAFADMMNERAAALGCTNTHFTNPNGLPDPNHYTTAHDMALIMQEAIKNETFLRVESDLSYTIPPTNMTAAPRQLQNHHVMLFQEDPTYGYQGAFAGKTGYTDEAHNTLVTASKRNNVTLICVVLTCDNLDYITDTRSLFDYGFQHFTHHTLKDTKKESLSGTISLPKDAKLKSATYTDPDDAAELESFTRQYFYDGHPIGTAEVSSKKASSSDSSSSSSEPSPTGIVTPEANRDDASSTGSLSSPLYILLGLNAAAILVLIFAVIQRSRKKRKRRRRKNHRK